jgi:hypothetical protein
VKAGLMRLPRLVPLATLTAVLAASCTFLPPGLPDTPRQTPAYTFAGSVPPLVARDAGNLTDLYSVAIRLAKVNPADPGFSRIPAAFLPLIHAAPEGRRFSGLPLPRALASGEPPERCPALAAAGGETREAAIAAATALCLDRLAAAGAGDCGCRLIALDSTLFAPREAFAYAPGLPARVLRAGALSPVRYVAVEDVQGDRVLTVIFAGERPVYVLEGDALTTLGPDGRPAAAPTPVRRQPIALDRGRFVERVEAADLTLLIGF